MIAVEVKQMAFKKAFVSDKDPLFFYVVAEIIKDDENQIPAMNFIDVRLTRSAGKCAKRCGRQLYKASGMIRRCLGGGSSSILTKESVLL